jgi:hypothetical protein
MGNIIQEKEKRYGIRPDRCILQMGKQKIQIPVYDNMVLE